MANSENGRRLDANALLLGALASYLRSKTANLTAAAPELGVSEKTFRKYIAALGVEEGSESDAEICRYGHQAYEAWQGIIGILQEQTVRLAMTSHISSNYFAELVDVVHRKDPSTRLVALDCRADKLRDVLARNEADLVIGPVYSPDILHQLTRLTHAREFELAGKDSKPFESQLVLVSPRDAAPALETDVFDPDWIREQAWVLQERGTATRVVLNRMYLPGLMNVRAESSDALQLVQMVARGTGRTIVANGPCIQRFIDENDLNTLRLSLENDEETRVVVYEKIRKRRLGTERRRRVCVVADAAVQTLASFLGSGSSSNGSA